ncbi:hypothetical protein KY289_013672 [Solanum tuberosum]|nr:hypothetical protein KY289_013672 [Solanum tuberosum]
MSRTEPRFRYPGSASCSSLIQLSTPESVVSLLAFRRTRLFCVLSLCLLGCCGVSAELRKPGQGFAWGQQWSPSAGPAQGVGSGRVAVGCGWQAFVAYANVGCYYVVGIPLGIVLGFYFNLEAKGIWLGMLGGTAMQTIILLWVTFRTDWEKEVEQAKSRLNMWQNNSKKPLFND